MKAWAKQYAPPYKNCVNTASIFLFATGTFTKKTSKISPTAQQDFGMEPSAS
jgi:hypothetical protein